MGGAGVASEGDVSAVVAGAARWAVVAGTTPGALAAVPDGSVDFVLTDPPYPEIDRHYGRMREPDWHALMRATVAETRRVLAPRGSAVFVLQPNSERVGRMRAWLWEFMAWTAREWNQVQDAWWWNTAALPTVHAQRQHGLMRPAVKACVWLGAPDCYRDQDQVLWRVSDATQAEALLERALVYRPSGAHIARGRASRRALERGGSTPCNLLPYANTDSSGSAGAQGHGAGTPAELCAWWLRYACPPGGLVLDPFCGAATVGAEALALGRRYVGIENDPASVPKARATCAAASAQGVLALGGAP